jgi:hypothetical protein
MPAPQTSLQQHRKIGNLLHRMGLPRHLVRYVRDGTLEAKLAEAYSALDALNERLNAWEAANPALAVKTPWHQGREAWKAQGRPRPPWYEALYWHEETTVVPIRTACCA